MPLGALTQRFKPAVERALILTGAGRVGRWAHRGRTLVLAYHNILADGAEPGLDRSLHLPLSRFRAQLDLLARTHEIIPLAQVRVAPRSDRPRAVITFDDAYAGAVDLGLGEVARRGWPVTMFVAPGILGRAGLWWDDLVTATGESVVTTSRDRLLSQLAGQDEAIRPAVRADGGQSRPVSSTAIASEALLLAAAKGPGVTLAAHSQCHPNLAALNPADLERELTEPLAWLRQSGARTLPWLAYPYGAWSPAVESAAERIGYEGALRIDGGWVRPGDQQFSLPRYTVPAGLSQDGFSLRAMGVLSR